MRSWPSNQSVSELGCKQDKQSCATIPRLFHFRTPTLFSRPQPKLRSRSGKLVKIAEQAFVEAKLLKRDEAGWYRDVEQEGSGDGNEST